MTDQEREQAAEHLRLMASTLEKGITWAPIDPGDDAQILRRAAAALLRQSSGPKEKASE